MIDSTTITIPNLVAGETYKLFCTSESLTGITFSWKKTIELSKIFTVPCCKIIDLRLYSTPDKIQVNEVVQNLINIDIKQIPVLLGEISIAPLIFCILHQADGELPQLLLDNLAGFLGQQVEDLFKLVGGRKW